MTCLHLCTEMRGGDGQSPSEGQVKIKPNISNLTLNCEYTEIHHHVCVPETKKFTVM